MPVCQLPTLFRVEPNLRVVATGRGEESFRVEGAMDSAGERFSYHHGEAALWSYHQGHLGSTPILSPQACFPHRQPFWTLHDHRSSPLAHNDSHLFPGGHSDPQVHLGIAHQWGQRQWYPGPKRPSNRAAWELEFWRPWAFVLWEIKLYPDIP